MGSSNQRSYETRMLGLTQQQMTDNETYRKEQQDKVAAQKQEFKQFQFTNPFEGMENPFEDLTVNQESARFQMEQGTQQRANIMAGLRGSAGSSGIAGLAQTLANQGTIQARQVSADISQQEAANARMAAQGGLQVDAMRRQGAAAVQAAEFGRESTLYAGELGELAGARSAEMGAYGNQMSALGMGASNAAQQSATNLATAGQVAGTAIMAFSDKRLKKNIKYISDSPSRIPIYTFEYVDDKYGKGVYQGAMSDEVPTEAVYSIDGYDIVDYSKIDVEFKKVK